MRPRAMEELIYVGTEPTTSRCSAEREVWVRYIQRFPQHNSGLGLNWYADRDYVDLVHEFQGDSISRINLPGWYR